MQVSKLGVLLTIAIGWSLSVTVNAVSPTPASKVASDAKQAYYSLTIRLPKITPSKDHINQLEILVAMLSEQALYRIDMVLARALGKNSKGYKNFASAFKTKMKSFDSFIPANIPANVTLAAKWANGSLDKKGGTFYMSNLYTDAIISDHEKKSELMSPDELKDRLGEELKDFDERYKPVVDALKILKKSTKFASSLTDLENLYVKAF